jgi:hypothetical protein
LQGVLRFVCPNENRPAPEDADRLHKEKRRREVEEGTSRALFALLSSNAP